MDFDSESFYIDRLTLEDASSLNRLMIRNAKNFQQHLPSTLTQNLSKSDSEVYIKRKIEEFQNRIKFTFAIKTKDTKAVAGLVIIKNIDWISKQAELAYCLGKQFSGNGWMSKSIENIKHFAFEELELKKLQIIIHKSNTRSINVAIRSGFTWEKTLEKAYLSEEELLDMELYEIVK